MGTVDLSSMKVATIAASNKVTLSVVASTTIKGEGGRHISSQLHTLNR
jgi:hypothetical protein